MPSKRILVPGKLRGQAGLSRDKVAGNIRNTTKPSQNTTKPSGPSGNTTKTSGYEVAAELRNLLKSNDIPASARVTAARTLAEIEGLIGRHQAAPERAGQPLSALSRGELVSELERLRTLFDVGLIR